MKKLLALFLLAASLAFGQGIPGVPSSQGIPHWADVGKAPWSTWQSLMNDTIRDCVATSGIGVYTRGPAAATTNNAYNGCVLTLQGEKVIFSPSAVKAVGIYAPSTNTFSSGAEAGGGGFAGGVLSPQGKVVLTGSTSIGIYDPATNLYAQGPTVTYPGLGCLSRQGKIILTGAQITIYDPITNTCASGPVSPGYAGAVLSPQGKIIAVPASADYVGVYDPATNLLVQGSGLIPLDSAFLCGRVSPQGKVILIPYYSDYIGIFDPETNAYTQGPLAAVGNPSYQSGCVSQQGKIVLSPVTSNIGIYDPALNVFVAGPPTAPDGIFSGACLTTQGKIILGPCYSDYVGIYDISSNNSFSLQLLLGPFLNKY